MNTDLLYAESLHHFIPNLLVEVEGERSLYEKLEPFIGSARRWIESEYLGPSDFLRPEHNKLALKVVVAKAFYDAVPSLDLVLTPSGFGVISTESIAPASKERVARLMTSLDDSIRANLAMLTDICRTYPQWCGSERGRYFGATFFPSLTDFNAYGAGRFKTYAEMRERCIGIESALAERYLGRDFMRHLRETCLQGTADPVINAVRTAVLSLLDSSRPSDINALWHAARPVVEAIRYDGVYYADWWAEMGGVFDAPGFVNNVRGGYYF